jgi:hypothetical protein
MAMLVCPDHRILYDIVSGQQSACTMYVFCTHIHAPPATAAYRSHGYVRVCANAIYMPIHVYVNMYQGQFTRQCIHM